MQPALSLAKRKLEEVRAEFEQLLQAEAEVVPVLEKLGSQAGIRARDMLRASGIEGVYTGIEGVLREVLTVVDGGVFAGPESWHAHLLAQAVEPNDANARGAVISESTYDQLDRLRSFRHVARNIYRHALRERDVEENLRRLIEVFPSFDAELQSFLRVHDSV